MRNYLLHRMHSELMPFNGANTNGLQRYFFKYFSVVPREIIVMIVMVAIFMQFHDWCK